MRGAGRYGSAMAVGRRSRYCGAGLAAVLVASAAMGQVWEVGDHGLVLQSGPQSGGQFGQTTVSGDFDGDGDRDLAVGAPFWDSPGLEDGGRIQIHLGSSQGLAAAPAYVLVGGLAEMGLGAALAAGNFDSDAADELVIGVPGLDIDGADSAGEIVVVNYSAGGSTLSSWSQGEGGIPGTPEAGDRFGEVLATGDFNDDGRDDLAIGIPSEDVVLADSGGVQVIYGSPSGLTSAGANLILQQAVTSPEQAGAGMGRALAAGDFDGDEQFWDLAVGFPGFDVGGLANSGGVAILFGGAGGLTTAGRQLIDDGDVGGAVEAGDGFGWALAAGDFDRTEGCWLAFVCRSDLAIGVPGQEVDGATDAGLVVFGDGGTGGIQVAGAQRFDQAGLLPAASGPETGDRFGAVLWSEYLASAQLDGPTANFAPSADDLVIAVPYENWQGTPYQGIVHLVFGSPSGLNATPGQFRMADPGLSSAPAAGFDNFGNAVAVGDFDGDEWDDLAIGVVGRDAGAANSGMVQVLYGALFADGFESAATANW